MNDNELRSKVWYQINNIVSHDIWIKVSDQLKRQAACEICNSFDNQIYIQVQSRTRTQLVQDLINKT